MGTYKGSLKGLSADKLGALAIKEAVYKSKLKSDDIDEVIMGHVLTSGLGQNPARQASIHAGIPIGASGTRILVTLIHEMIKQNKNKGCATLCIGGGMGIAMCIERN
ncbi:hypothetical protein OAC02_01375 [Candidatus Pelagibacter sp.]|nr:hypothetical protein [Candidatus Pelagibacter sp.]